MYQLIECLSDSVGRENIILDSPVVSIKQTLDNEEKYCTVITKEKDEYDCRFVIMAVPPHLISKNLPLLLLSLFGYIHLNLTCICLLW